MQETKRCPYCKEEILADAIKCKHCGSVLTEEPRMEDESSYEEKTRRIEKHIYGVINLENLPIGHIIDDRYEIKEKLGQGGFGAVYRVYDKKMEVDKALKIFPEALSNDIEAMENLRKEAKTMIKLNHPNIVRVYDFYDKGNIKYIDMEYIDGKTLTQLKLNYPDKRMPEEKVKSLTTQILEGLTYAHSKNIIHKDISPQNIMVTNDGKVKIMDFGIAETVHTSMSVIQNVSITGKLMYMSPEQVRGRNINQQSDIYSLGATLYDLLSGHPPFYKGDISYQIINEPVKRIENVSNEMNNFLEKCMAKNVEDRFRNFAEVKEVLVDKTEIHKEQIQKNKEKTVEVIIDIEPNDAKVRIDSVIYKAEDLENIRFSAGLKNIVIEKKGYKKLEAELEITEDDENYFIFEMERKSNIWFIALAIFLIINVLLFIWLLSINNDYSEVQEQFESPSKTNPSNSTIINSEKIISGVINKEKAMKYLYGNYDIEGEVSKRTIDELQSDEKDLVNDKLIESSVKYDKRINLNDREFYYLISFTPYRPDESDLGGYSGIFVFEKQQENWVNIVKDYFVDRYGWGRSWMPRLEMIGDTIVGVGINGQQMGTGGPGGISSSYKLMLNQGNSFKKIAFVSLHNRGIDSMRISFRRNKYRALYDLVVTGYLSPKYSVIKILEYKDNKYYLFDEKKGKYIEDAEYLNLFLWVADFGSDFSPNDWLIKVYSGNGSFTRKENTMDECNTFYISGAPGVMNAYNKLKITIPKGSILKAAWIYETSGSYKNSENSDGGSVFFMKSIASNQADISNNEILKLFTVSDFPMRKWNEEVFLINQEIPAGSYIAIGGSVWPSFIKVQWAYIGIVSGLDLEINRKARK